ncbi:MAG: hypothetical protein ABIJ09_24445 [Pseudomonadota bacterium]
MIRSTALASCALLVSILVPALARSGVDDYRLDRILVLTERGGRVSWSPDGQWIAYDRREDDDLYDVHIIRPDGTDQHCLTCEHPQLPGFNVGQPEWHPGGRFLVIEVEMAEHGGSHEGSRPGSGIYNNLWVLDLEDGFVDPPATQLTDVRDGRPLGEAEGGVLHSAFNHDGSRLLWTDMEDYQLALIVGDWQLAIADFVTDPAPALVHTQFYNPGPKPEWFEAHGWGPPGEDWVYFACTPLAGMHMWNADICRMDLDRPEQVTRLTFSAGVDGEPSIYDEHAKMSPLHDAITWASDAVVDRNRMELFMANLDGSGARRVTSFNEAGHAHATGHQTQTWDHSWNPAPAEGWQELAVIVVYTDEDPPRETIRILHFEVGEGIAPESDPYAQAPRESCGCRAAGPQRGGPLAEIWPGLILLLHAGRRRRFRRTAASPATLDKNAFHWTGSSEYGG